MTAFTAFTVTTYAFSNSIVSTTVTCDGGHECDDKCKKGKDGKCDKTTADAKGDKNTSHACCSKKSKKSCKGDSKKSEKDTKEETK